MASFVNSGRILFTLAIAAAALLAGCGTDGDQGSDDELSVVTSTSILTALAGEVGGDLIEVEPLIGPGVDPHTFELTPGDIRTLASADLVLINGLGLDDHLIDEIESANDGAGIVVVTEGIELLGGGEDDHEHEDENEDEHEEDEHEHGEVDPHVWQDPLRVKVMVENVASALADVDPVNAATFTENSATYQTTLDDTHREIQALVDVIPAEHRKIVTNHDAFAYFADRYGLEVVGTVIPGTSSEADPSAGEIADLIELIEHEHVRAIFAEALIDPNVAESLASDTGVTIVYGLYTEQVGEEGSGVETVHQMLLANAKKITDALR